MLSRDEMDENVDQNQINRMRLDVESSHSRSHESSPPMPVPPNVNLTDLNDINIGNSPDMMNGINNNGGINNIAGAEAESRPPIMIHPVPSETQTPKGYNPRENKAQSYLITGVTGALLNSNQIATDVGKGIHGTLATMEEETDEHSDGIAALSNGIGNGIGNGGGSGLGSALASPKLGNEDE